MKLAGSFRDRRHRGQIHTHQPGRNGPLPLDQLRELRADPPGRVLSAYLAVDARRGESLDGGWRLRFKAAARDLVERSVTPEEANALVRLVRWIEPRLAALPAGELRRGLALFATESPRRLELLTLPRPVTDAIAWDDEPDLGQLMHMAEDFPTLGIVAVDGERARLITARLGEPVDERSYAFDLDTEDWRRMEGRAPQALFASGTTQVDRFARRVAAQESRWLHRLVPLIGAAARADGWNGAVVVTPPDLRLEADELAAAGVQVLRQVRGTFSYFSAAEITDLVVEQMAG